MKKVHGVWLPDQDEHFEPMLHRSERRFGKATYQINKYDAAMHHVTNRAVALDIGAHVGLWSLAMLHDFTFVHAFEPVAAHRECYVKNIGDLKGFILHPNAVSDTVETIFMETPAHNTGHTQVSLAHMGEATQSVRIDDMEFEDVIGFMKIDVEGFELRVVRGAEATIRDHKPVIIIEQKRNGNAERFGVGQHAAVDLLKSWGMLEMRVMAGDHIMVWA